MMMSGGAVHSFRILMTGRHYGVHIHIAGDNDNADPSLVAKRWAEKRALRSGRTLGAGVAEM
jgi:predicted AAA+ superfamily ATPase